MWLDSKLMQAALTRLPWLRVGSMALLSLLLMGSVFGVWKAYTMWEEREEAFPLVSYEHHGEFDYSVFVESAHLFGSSPPETPGGEAEARPLYFTNIINDIDVKFCYEFAFYNPVTEVSSEGNIVAIITGPSGWKKLFPLKSFSELGSTFNITFPLELEWFNEEINTIEEELGIRERPAEENVYNLVIEARVDVQANNGSKWIKDTFVQPMEIKVGRGTLQWDNELVLSERKFHEGFSYQHRGNFDYTIRLKRNSLYGTEINTLNPTLYQSSPAISRPPGEVYFPKITDVMWANFSYRFNSDRPVTNLTEEVEITAVLEFPDMWSKTFTLVEESQKSSDFTIDFPVDINYFHALTAIIREELGMGAAAHNLTIKAVVHTTADSEFGHIDEAFTQTLEGRLGVTTTTWSDELVKSQPRTIEGTRIVSNPNVNIYRLWSPIVLAVVLLAFFLVVWNAVRARPIVSRIEEEAFRAKKKYKGVIVDVNELLPVRPAETIVPFGSVDELVKVADALLKPVFHQATIEKHIYCVIDGLTRYEYISKLRFLIKTTQTSGTDQSTTM